MITAGPIIRRYYYMPSVKRNLYFENSKGEMRLLCEGLKETEVPKKIIEFLESKNYKSYYMRINKDTDYNMYDVGSHTEFFYWGEPK